MKLLATLRRLVDVSKGQKVAILLFSLVDVLANRDDQESLVTFSQLLTLHAYGGSEGGGGGGGGSEGGGGGGGRGGAKEDGMGGSTWKDLFDVKLWSSSKRLADRLNQVCKGR